MDAFTGIAVFTAMMLAVTAFGAVIEWLDKF